MSKTYIKYILLMLMPFLYYILLGAVGGYYTYFVMQFLLFTFYGVKRVSLDSLILAISVIFLIAILVGFVNLVFGLNDFKNYIIYSLMSVSYIFAILAGKYFSYKSFKEGLLLLAILAVGELLLVIPRIFVIGLDVRTSLGFTYLLPCLFFFLKANKKGFLVFILASFLYFLAIFLSGLRSVLIPGFVIYFISLIYLYKTFDKNKVVKKFNKFLFLIPLIIILSVGLNLDLFKIRDRIYNATNIVAVRMEQTLLNPDGFRLDPSEGRKEESEFAIGTFKERSYTINYFIGMGYGFSYLDHSKDGELTAHVHITPVAYFLRHGILGLCLYLILFAKILSSFFMKNKVSFAIKFSLFIWLLSSFFAGVIIMPIFWFFWAFVFYSSKNTRAS